MNKTFTLGGMPQATRLTKAEHRQRTGDLTGVQNFTKLRKQIKTFFSNQQNKYGHSKTHVPAMLQ